MDKGKIGGGNEGTGYNTGLSATTGDVELAGSVVSIYISARRQ